MGADSTVTIILDVIVKSKNERVGQFELRKNDSVGYKLMIATKDQ